MIHPLQIASGLTVAQATELLDWLENHNIQPRDVTTSDTGYLTVRWVA